MCIYINYTGRKRESEREIAKNEKKQFVMAQVVDCGPEESGSRDVEASL